MPRTTKSELQAENEKLRLGYQVAKLLLSQSILREYEARQMGISIVEVKLPSGSTVNEHAKEVLG